MADPKEKDDDIAVMEAQDGSATVDIPENLLNSAEDGENTPPKSQNAEGGKVESDDEDHPGDNEELRAAKRNRRRAKKDLIRKTNQEKDVRLTQLQRENRSEEHTSELQSQSTTRMPSSA